MTGSDDGGCTTLAEWAESAAEDVARRGVAIDLASVAADLDVDRSR